MAGINLQGGFGAGGAVDALRVLIAENFRKQQEQDQVAQEQARLAEAAARREEDARQANQRNVVDLGHLGVAKDTAGLAREKFGHDVSQDTLFNPLKVQELGANIANTQANTGEILRQPTKEEQDYTRRINLFNLDTSRRAQEATQENQFRLGQIRLGNQGSLDVANARGASEKLLPVQGPDGETVYVPQSQAAGMRPAQTTRRPLGQERVALGFFNRAQEANKIAQPLEDQIGNIGLLDQARLQYFPNWLQSEEGKSYRQAQRTFTEARLRKESGAAIPASEYENDSKTYFAQPGDTPAVLAQKRAARQEVLDGLGFSAGPAYQEFYGTPFERKSQNAKPEAGVQFRFNPKTGKIEPVK